MMLPAERKICMIKTVYPLFDIKGARKGYSLLLYAVCACYREALKSDSFYSLKFIKYPKRNKKTKTQTDYYVSFVCSIHRKNDGKNQEHSSHDNRVSGRQIL